MNKLSDADWGKIKDLISANEQCSKFTLGDAEREYISERGMEIIRLHILDFVKKRLQPANPRNDGRQTPAKGHPVFIAQHATATNSRLSMNEVHGVPLGKPLDDDQVEWTVEVISRWLNEQMA